MKINEVINSAVKRLGGTEESRLAAEVLLAHCLGVKKEDLFLNAETEVEEPKLNRFLELVNRHFEGEPVAYLTNKKEFYGLSFYVDSRVLIPRPETELLVDEVLSRVCDPESSCKSVHPGNMPQPSHAANPSDPGNPGDQARQADLPIEILDIGTGSGCIAIALAKKLPKARFMATDVSEDALEVAVKNAEKHNVLGRIDFVCANLLENVSGRFDVIVANLPYIGEKKYNFVSKEARAYEPYGALFGGDNGLRIYERLFKQICERSWRPKFLFGEFGFSQGDEMRALLGKYFDGQSIEIIKDYASIERMFVVGFDGNE
jgi:release factor glutamine methyltransferase